MPTILIVDDEPDLRYLMRRLLEQAGYDVVEAPHGGAALELVEREPPDVVLCDTSMPVVDGVEMLARLRADGRFARLPVILWGDNPDRDAPADRIFAKPYGGPAIVHAVNELLER